MDTAGNQLRREGESYAEYMDRLYRARTIDYRDKVRDPFDGQFVPSSKHDQRLRWSFRVPHELAKPALKFMREQNMSITKYLTFAMHQLHTKNK